MSLSKLGRALALLLTASVAAYAQPQLSPQANGELTTAQDTLAALTPYVKNLGGLSEAVKALNQAAQDLDQAKKGTPDYSDKLDRYKAALAAVKAAFGGQVKGLADEQSPDAIWDMINWDHESFKKCTDLARNELTNPEPGSQPAQTLNDEKTRCRLKIQAAQKTLTDYIAKQTEALVQADEKIGRLQKQHDEATDDATKQKLQEQINAAKAEREKIKEKRDQAVQVKKSLSIGDFLLALAEFVLGVVGAVSCIEDGDVSTCAQATAAIASSVQKLTGGGKEVTENRPIEEEKDAPRDPAVVAQEGALNAAAAKPLADSTAPVEFVKLNPGTEVIPADGTSNLILVQRRNGSVVAEVDLVDATSKQVLLALTDDQLFINTDNAALAGISKFATFVAATKLTGDSPGTKVLLYELRGRRLDGKAGDLLLRLVPRHPSGKVVAVGE